MRENKFGIDTVTVGKILHCCKPAAFTRVEGDFKHQNLTGCVLFYEAEGMVLIVADIHGLPITKCGCSGGIYAMHIHEGNSCSGDADDSFADAGSHFDMNDCDHPYHSGDMPPLFSNNGNAWCAFATSKFSIPDIIGRTVIIHEGIDDFTSQPAGNAGKKIGCGIICKNI